MNRRTFLKTMGAGALVGAGFGARPALASGRSGGDKEFVGVLVDTTRCIGCRSCEVACAKAHDMPVPDLGDATVFDKPRTTSPTQWTVVSRQETDRGDVFVKKQCMHCNQPGCVAPCLVKAMVKRPEGPVIWKENCMGCRICMVSCPFDIPKFEYDKPAPKVQKCNLCWDRLQEGKPPACVEACPQEALVFGTRRELLEEGYRRIYASPKKYVHHVYGDREVGGTGYLYLSAVPFEQLGFRTDLGSVAYPEFTLGFMYTVIIVDLLWPAFLIGGNALTGRKGEVKARRGSALPEALPGATEEKKSRPPEGSS